jgi:hypothetical protein
MTANTLNMHRQAHRRTQLRSLSRLRLAAGQRFPLDYSTFVLFFKSPNEGIIKRQALVP